MFQTRAFVCGSHDAGTTSCDDHHVRLCQGCADLAGQRIQGVFYRCSRGAEDGDFTSPFELFQYSKSSFKFANRLQRDLGIPAIKIVVGHAQYSQHHFTIKRAVRAVGSNLLQLLVDLAGKVQAFIFEVRLQGVTGLVGHVLLLPYNILGRAANRLALRHRVSKVMLDNGPAMSWLAIANYLTYMKFGLAREVSRQHAVSRYDVLCAGVFTFCAGSSRPGNPEPILVCWFYIL